MKARAVRFVAPQAVDLCEVEVPDVGEGEVLVRTAYSGISGGTEMLAYSGHVDPDLPLDETIGALAGTFSYPFRYGYSCVGLVERSRGALAEGDLVFAFHPHQDRFVAPASSLVRLEGVGPRVATLFPLVETALQVALDAGAVQREHVVVLGLGPLGILAAALLQSCGARVTAAEPRPWRRHAAASFGVRPVPTEGLQEVVAGATAGRGAAVVVEASGSPDALASALPLLAHEGTALVASWYGSKQVSLPLGAEFHRRRLCVRSTQVSSIPAALSARWTMERRRAETKALLQRLPLDILATHEWPVARAPDAFAAVARGQRGLLHAALRYG